MIRKCLETNFPNLLNTHYSVTSPQTPEYNCVAWAAGDNTAWWEPDPLGMYYWPPGAPRNYRLHSYIQAFQTLGYILCTDYEFESEYEKVALYVYSNGEFKHIARQIGPGKWTSKLGKSFDIEHVLEGLSDSGYGKVGVVLKRES